MFGLKRDLATGIHSDQHPAADGAVQQADGAVQRQAVDGLLWAPGGRRWSYELTLLGDLDLAGAWCLQAMLREVLASGARDIHLEMAGVSFLDSAGLHVLVQTRSQLSELHGRLTLREPSRAVRRLVCLADLCPVLGLDTQPIDCRHNDTGAARESGRPRYPAAGPPQADQPLRITGVHVIGVHTAGIHTADIDTGEIDAAGTNAA